jgi:hypothetical protein
MCVRCVRQGNLVVVVCITRLGMGRGVVIDVEGRICFHFLNRLTLVGVSN